MFPTFLSKGKKYNIAYNILTGKYILTNKRNATSKFCPAVDNNETVGKQIRPKFTYHLSQYVFVRYSYGSDLMPNLFLC